jgi:uncharacterized membrane protein YfcA
MNLILVLLIIGFAAGVLSGVVGIGGGLVIVPALTILLGMNQLTAQGTTLALFLPPIGFLAVYNYYKAGFVDVKSGLIMAITFIIGGYFGSKISISLDQQTVKKIFGIITLLVAVKMIFGK